jgi:hypothetical protein
MAIDEGSLIEMAVRQRFNDVQVINAWHYHVDSIPVTVTPVQLAEAWWNHVKTTYRALVGNNITTPFQSVYIREMNNQTGDYAEFDIPIGEKTGTRQPPTQSELLPLFCAVGVRLVVGTRATRPGQKRFAYLYEGDNNQGILGSALISLVNAHMAIMTASMLLGAPAATAVLQPIVTRRDAQGFVTAYQNIQGYLVNPFITTQNSRKPGRGA